MRSAEYLRSATLGLRWCSALRTISSTASRAHNLTSPGPSKNFATGFHRCAESVPMILAPLLATSCGVLAPLLLVLNLKSNCFGDDGCEAIATALRKGALPQLKSLYIHSNRIGDSGFKALTAALKPTAGETTPCHAIRELDVRNNLATDVGRRALKAVAAVRGFGCDMDRDNNDDAASHESEEF